MGATQAFPEGFEGVHAFADEDNICGEEIEHNARLGADRQGAEGMFDAALDPDILGPAMGALQLVARLFDANRCYAGLEVWLT